MSDQLINILFVEDSEDDLLLITRHLSKQGLVFHYNRVDNEKDLIRELNKQKWDIIISDYIIPGFGGLEVLKIVQEKSPGLSVIIVSGALGEELAVEVMKAGAQDYVLKDKLIRLIPAIQRELTETVVRKDKKIAEDRLEHQAFYDQLTNFANRSLFIDRLKQAFNRYLRRKDLLFAVIFLNINRFKIVNESLGHEAGDQLLINFSRRIERCIRPGDTVARFSGDIFALLIEDIYDISEATRVVERIRSDMKIPFSMQGNEIYLNISAGIVLSSDEYTDAEEILRNADIATNRAKKNMGITYQVYDKAMHKMTLQQLKLESELRRAVQNDEFIIYFQPIVDIQDMKIVALEALLRWEKNDEILLPAHFLSMAEETGIIVLIERMVIDKVAQKISEWNNLNADQDKITVSINLSAKHFLQPDLHAYIDSTIKRYKIAPSQLIVEITESVIMKNVKQSIVTLQKLKDLDICLYIDDFGTGYSSLSYLLRFPVDTLKVDRSFITELGTEDTKNEAIVQSIISLSENLKLGLIAEGVETVEQLKLLKKMNCRHAQGYLFSFPLPEHETDVILRNRNIDLKIDGL